MTEPVATQPQVKFLGVLFQDCGFTLPQKRDYLMLRYKKRYTDELTVRQASVLIGELIAKRDQGKELPKEEE